MINDGTNKIDDNVRSYLLIGQSNMAGRGEFADVAPVVNANCYMLRMGRWQPMSEPINPDRAVSGILYHSGIGLSASFADLLQKYSGSKIGLIPCADGGTKLCQWMPGEVLFDHAVMMTRLALRSSELGGILWHQGESDCTCDEDVDSYKERFTIMINEMKRQLDVPDIPVIIGELSHDLGERFGDRPMRLNRIFAELATEIPNCRVVSSAGLTLKPDKIHFDSVSYREFGRRYFEQLVSLYK